MKKLFFILAKLQGFLAGNNSPSHETVICDRTDIGLECPCSEVNSRKLSDLVDQIVFLLKEEQIYKSPDLDLKALSERLGTPAYLVPKLLMRDLK